MEYTRELEEARLNESFNHLMENYRSADEFVKSLEEAIMETNDKTSQLRDRISKEGETKEIFEEAMALFENQDVNSQLLIGAFKVKKEKLDNVFDLLWIFKMVHDYIPENVLSLMEKEMETAILESMEAYFHIKDKRVS